MVSPGIGITFLPALVPLLAERGSVDIVELEPQMFWGETGDPEEPYRSDGPFEAAIGALAQEASIHSVSAPIGGSGPPDPANLRGLGSTAAALGPIAVSDHLSFNVAGPPGGRYWTGAFLPPAQCEATVERVAANVQALARATGHPVAVEPGVNYLSWTPGTMADGEFVAAVAEAAGCGILLDLHNIWTNERNGRQPAGEFVAQLPLDRIWEIHVAGGIEYQGFWLDAHSGPVPLPVLRLLATLAPRLPNLRIVNLEIVPEYVTAMGIDAVRAELAQLRDVCASGEASPAGYGRVPRRAAASPRGPDLAPEEWEDTLGALVTGQPVTGEVAGRLRGDPGLAVQRVLVESARAGGLTGALRLSVRLILRTIGTEATRLLLADFWRTAPPSAFAATEAAGFADYVGAAATGVAYLDEVLAVEMALIRTHADGSAARVYLEHDPVRLLGALAAGRLPGRLPSGSFAVDVQKGAVLDPALAGALAGGRGPAFVTL
jgi:uncharacterized protein (UPF0276 family)